MKYVKAQLESGNWGSKKTTTNIEDHPQNLSGAHHTVGSAQAMAFPQETHDLDLSSAHHAGGAQDVLLPQESQKSSKATNKRKVRSVDFA